MNYLKCIILYKFHNFEVKILQENLAEQGEGEKSNLRNAVIGGNLAFGIGLWGANQSGFSKQLVSGSKYMLYFIVFI